MNKSLIKIYYYKDGKKEVLIGNQEAYEAKPRALEGKKVFTKMMKRRGMSVKMNNQPQNLN